MAREGLEVLATVGAGGDGSRRGGRGRGGLEVVVARGGRRGGGGGVGSGGGLTGEHQRRPPAVNLLLEVLAGLGHVRPSTFIDEMAMPFHFAGPGQVAEDERDERDGRDAPLPPRGGGLGDEALAPVVENDLPDLFQTEGPVEHRGVQPLDLVDAAFGIDLARGLLAGLEAGEHLGHEGLDVRRRDGRGLLGQRGLEGFDQNLRISHHTPLSFRSLLSSVPP